MKNKKVVIGLIVIVSILLIGFGVVVQNTNKTNSNTKNNKSQSVKNKVDSIEDAIQLLYTTYILEGEQSYDFLKETEKEYFFKISNSNDGKQYIVIKSTGEILISQTLQ